MKLYNTMHNKKEEFKPIDENRITMYVCGPTVYNYFHIGNARPFIIFDILRRYFIYKGYNVKYVQNFTDVDDRIINKANEEKVSASEISERYIKEYFADAHALGIKDADVHPKVSETMDEIIEFIAKLIEKDHAYEVNGSVYYRVDSFDDYGKLSGQSKEDLLSGARIEVNDEKESPLDFVLWKAKKEGEPFWISPWGEGRPGWHIECSAMSRKYLGETIDIHGGGQDLIFPHHENEIAQSCALSGKTFANYWLHNGFMNIDNEKMSKSLGNFFTVRDIAAKYDLEVVRLFIISVQYRNPINYSDESLSQSKAALARLYNVKNNLNFYIANAEDKALSEKENKIIDEMQKFIAEFENAMEDDINTAAALGVMFEMAKFINISVNEDTSKEALEKIYDIFMAPANVFGLLSSSSEEILDGEIEKLIEERQLARKNKNFARSDEIRDVLKGKGITLEDTREGVKWKRESN